MRVHFGLGAATKLDCVQVRWPSGLVEHFDNLRIDSIQTIKEGTGTVQPSEAKPTEAKKP